MKPYNTKIINAQAMNADFSSPAQLLDQMWGFCIQAVYTGSSITGAFHLEGSADPMDIKPGNSIAPTVTNWTTIADSTVSITSAGSYVWDVNTAGYNYVRLVYVDGSSGTSNGVCNARINAKGV